MALSSSNDGLLRDLRDEVRALRSDIEALHFDVSIARAELDELLSLSRLLVDRLAAGTASK